MEWEREKPVRFWGRKFKQETKIKGKKFSLTFRNQTDLLYFPRFSSYILLKSKKRVQRDRKAKRNGSTKLVEGEEAG
jgi:hypothetical protein